MNKHSKDDQKRVSSPGQAIVDGSSLIIVGRPITASVDPIKSIEDILKDIREKLKVEIKICGINTIESAMASKGAKYVGFVFCEKSPRFVNLDIVKEIIPYLEPKQKKVGLFVNSKIDIIKKISRELELDAIQLHGDEDREFIQNLKASINCSIIKAIPVKTIKDIKISEEFKEFCDMILFDTKTDSNEFGGTGISLDWKLLQNFRISKKWMIAGGLNINNVKEAINLVKPDVIDISSGVEKKGVKCEQKIRNFIKYVEKL